MILGELLDRQASNITGINKRIGSAIGSYDSHTNVIEKPVSNYNNSTQSVNSSTNNNQSGYTPAKENLNTTNSLSSTMNFSTFALRNSQINASNKYNNQNGSMSLFPKPYANTNSLQNSGFTPAPTNQSFNNGGMNWRLDTCNLPLQSLEKVSLTE